MRFDHTSHDLTVAARLHARVDAVSAEVRTLQSLPLQPQAQTIVAVSKTDLECATTRLASRPNSLELEHLGRWIEMVECQLRVVRTGEAHGHHG
jgi:type II secretory pathway component PulM